MRGVRTPKTRRLPYHGRPRKVLETKVKEGSSEHGASFGLYAKEQLLTVTVSRRMG